MSDHMNAEPPKPETLSYRTPTARRRREWGFWSVIFAWVQPAAFLLMFILYLLSGRSMPMWYAFAADGCVLLIFAGPFVALITGLLGVVDRNPRPLPCVVGISMALIEIAVLAKVFGHPK